MKPSHTDPNMKSTDLLYLNQEMGYTPEKVAQLAEALDVKRRVLTRMMVTDERIFYRQCVNAVQSTLYIPDLNEKNRSQIITNIADRLYDSGISEFLSEIKRRTPSIEAKRHMIDSYIDRLTEDYRNQPYDSTPFADSWQNDYHQSRWVRHAVKDTATIFNRIENPPHISPQKEGKLVNKAEFVRDCVKTISAAGEHYRVAKSISLLIISDTLERLFGSHEAEFSDPSQAPGSNINTELTNQGLSPVRRATLQHPDERKMVAFLGGIGCGKSEIMRVWWEKNKTDDFIVVNTDFTKQTLSLRAVVDGKITSDEINPNVAHEESATASHEVNAAYAKNIKNPVLAKSGKVPNMVMETDVLDEKWREAAFAGRGEREIHYVSAPLKIAEASVEIRKGQANRKIPPERIENSAKEAAKNLLTLTEQRRPNAKIYLYDRTEVEGAPKYVGVIDLNRGELFVENLQGLFHIAERSAMGTDTETSKRQFIAALCNNHITINVMAKIPGTDRISTPVTISSRLNPADKRFEYRSGLVPGDTAQWDLSQSGLTEEEQELASFAKSTAISTTLGITSTRYPREFKGIIR